MGGYSQTYNSKKVKKILNKTHNTFQSLQAGSYQYGTTFKMLTEEDTAKKHGNVWFYYNDDELNYLQNNTFTYQDFSNKELFISQNQTSYKFFTKPKAYIKDTIVRLYDDAVVFLTLKGKQDDISSTMVYYKGKEIVNNKKCYVIEIVYPEEKDENLGLSSQYTKTLYLNRKTRFPEKMLQVFDMGGLIQYSEINIKDFITYPTKNNIEKLISDSLATLMQIYSEYMPEVITQDTIVEGVDSTKLTTAPDFRLKQLGGDTVQLSTIDTKLVVLDFWYVSCAPCLASIPFLNDLYKRYKDKDVAFYSVNAYDEIEKINKIKELRGIEYPILLGKDVKIDKMYNINSFPRLLVIDKNLNIIYEERGFGLGMEEEVFSKIDELLAD